MKTHNRAKTSWPLVRAARARFARYPDSDKEEWAFKLGVNPRSLYRIINGDTWKEEPKRRRKGGGRKK